MALPRSFSRFSGQKRPLSGCFCPENTSEVDDRARRYVCSVQVVANGNAVELDDGATLDDLLTQLGLGAKWVVVERNGEPVPRRETASTVLVDGDRLELVRAVAGG